jgi:hypothetical protein
VAYRAYVDVRFRAFKFALCHDFSLSMSNVNDKSETKKLCYVKFLVPMARIGLATSPLPRECSTTEPHGQTCKLERVKGIEPSS